MATRLTTTTKVTDDKDDNNDSGKRGMRGGTERCVSVVLHPASHKTISKASCADAKGASAQPLAVAPAGVGAPKSYSCE